MDKVQKHNLFNTNTPSSESYRNKVGRYKLYAAVLQNPKHALSRLSTFFYACLIQKLSKKEIKRLWPGVM
jgi:hypothetical protein